MSLLHKTRWLPLNGLEIALSSFVFLAIAMAHLHHPEGTPILALPSFLGASLVMIFGLLALGYNTEQEHP